MVNNKYLVAARDLLIRFGKPMHYITIASAAIKLGLLESKGSTPEISMSSVLSKDVANNPNSIFKKVRAGVYDIIPGVKLGFEITNYNNIGVRIAKLSRQIGFRNELAVIRRSLFLLKRAYEYAENDMKITICNDTNSMNIVLENDHDTLKSLSTVSDYEGSKFHSHRASFNMNKGICNVIEELRLRLGLKSIFEVVDLSVAILELCIRLHKNGSVILKGKKGYFPIRILATREKRDHA